MALDAYRAGGFTPDDFARSRAAREAMADALTRAEDALEINGGRENGRAAVRAFRRRLEVQLWP